MPPKNERSQDERYLKGKNHQKDDFTGKLFSLSRSLQVLKLHGERKKSSEAKANAALQGWQQEVVSEFKIR